MVNKLVYNNLTSTDKMSTLFHKLMHATRNMFVVFSIFSVFNLTKSVRGKYTSVVVCEELDK